MRTKILAAFVAGGLLVGAGFLTSAISSPGTALAQDETDDSDDRGLIPRALGFLGDVLDDLVGDGTITQDQADAIVEATEDKAGELMDEHMALRGVISDALDDGVLTEEEASELPDDHWLFDDSLDEAWEDGELTLEEFRQAGPHHRFHPFRNGLRLGSLLDDGGIDQEELEGLGDDHPLNQLDLDEYMSDGQITPDEFRQLFQRAKDSLFGKDT